MWRACWLLAASLSAGAPAGVAAPPALDLNHATRSQLERLPQVGPAKAEAILRWRAGHGPFRKVADLERVPGFGPATVKRLQSEVTVDPPLQGVQRNDAK